MNNYLVDESVLGQFADALIKEKFPDDTAAHADLRNALMAKTDHQIIKSIISNLTEEQGAELSKLLDSDTTAPEDFDKFFEKYGVNLEEVIKTAMLEVKDEFEKGGQDEWETEPNWYHSRR